MAWSNQQPIARRTDRIYLRDEIEVYQFPHNKFVQVRYVGPVISYASGYVEFMNSKTNKKSGFSIICSDYSHKDQGFVKDKCPWRKNGVYVSQRFVANMIVRDEQKNPPRRMREPTAKESKLRNMLGEKWHIKDPESKTWTPVFAHDMPSGLADKLKNMAELNKHKIKGKRVACDISDPVYGMDVIVKYDKNAKGAAMWEVQHATKKPLTKKERAYCIWNLSNLKSLEPEPLKVAKENWKRIEPNFIPRESDFKKDKKKKNNKRRDRDERSSRGSRDRNERVNKKRERSRDSNKRDRRDRDRKRNRRRELDIDSLD